MLLDLSLSLLELLDVEIAREVLSSLFEDNKVEAVAVIVLSLDDSVAEDVRGEEVLLDLSLIEDLSLSLSSFRVLDSKDAREGLLSLEEAATLERVALIVLSLAGSVAEDERSEVVLLDLSLIEDLSLSLSLLGVLGSKDAREGLSSLEEAEKLTRLAVIVLSLAGVVTECSRREGVLDRSLADDLSLSLSLSLLELLDATDA